MPSTPPPTTFTAPEIKSTPAHRDSASAQESFAKYCYAEVRDTLFDDLQEHQTCDVSTMLKALLKRCLEEGSQPDSVDLEELLQRCLDAVAERLKSDRDTCKNLLGYLKTYFISKNETAKYEPFVEFCNALLRTLNDIHVDGLRQPSPLDVVFFRNNPKWIVDGRTKLSPDVCIISSKDVASTSAIAPNDDPDDDSTTQPAKKRCVASSSKAATGKVSSPIASWALVLSVVEGKLGAPQDISSLCLDIKEIKHIPPQDHVDVQKIGRGSLQSHSQSTSGSCNTGNKRKKGISTPNTSMVERHPMSQSARYAMARLSSSPAIAHMLNMVFKGRVIYLWYYDSEAMIQTCSLDFVDNLAHFGVLLLALQRFTEVEWGIITKLRDALFDTVGDVGSPKPLIFPPSTHRPQTEIVIDYRKILRHSYALSGRQTRVYEARSKAGEPGENDLVVKAYFPERIRVSEVEIIEEASKWEDEEPDIRGHLPEVVCHMDFGSYATDQIRRDLGLCEEENPKGTRIPRVIVFKKYEPITKAGDSFQEEFWKLFRCHYRLWLRGVEHGDISLSNLLWDPRTKMAKLNDFDLARLRSRSVDLGHTRMGTMAFMAFDLLCKHGLAGQLQRMYRHDAESFLWVLLWVLARFRDGKEVYRHFDSFVAPTYEECYKKKLTFISQVIDVQPNDRTLWDSLWPVLAKLEAAHQQMLMSLVFKSDHTWGADPREAVEWLKAEFPQMAAVLGNLKLTLE